MSFETSSLEGSLPDVHYWSDPSSSEFLFAPNFAQKVVHVTSHKRTTRLNLGHRERCSLCSQEKTGKKIVCHVSQVIWYI